MGFISLAFAAFCILLYYKTGFQTVDSEKLVVRGEPSKNLKISIGAYFIPYFIYKSSSYLIDKSAYAYDGIFHLIIVPVTYISLLFFALKYDKKERSYFGAFFLTLLSILFGIIIFYTLIFSFPEKQPEGYY